MDLFDDADGSDDASVIVGRGGNYDASTGLRGRIMAVWNTRRAGSNSGLISMDPTSGDQVPVAYGDVVVRVAFQHWVGGEPRRFLIQETRRSDIRFSKGVTLQDGEEKWLNLGQFPDQDVRFGLFYWDRVRGWVRGNEINIGRSTVEHFEAAQIAGGYPIENYRYTGYRARLETITGQNRLCDGSVGLRVVYCEDEARAPVSRTFVL